MDIRIQIEDALLNSLKQRLRATNTTEVIKEALGFLDWASEEASHGRIIVSMDESGGEARRIESPGLRQARLVSAKARNGIP